MVVNGLVILKPIDEKDLKGFMIQTVETNGRDMRVDHPSKLGKLEIDDDIKILKHVVGEYGDRRQEIVFMGQNMNQDEITKEMKLTPQQWMELFEIPSELDFEIEEDVDEDDVEDADDDHNNAEDEIEMID